MSSSRQAKAASSEAQLREKATSTKPETFEHAENPAVNEMALPGKLDWTTKFMVVFSLWIGLAGWALQFDTGYTGIVLRMPPFNDAFGHCEPKTVPRGSGSIKTTVCKLSATQQSLQSSIYLLFMAAGAAIAGITGNHMGRRRTVQLGCLLIVVGAGGMLGTSGNLLAYIACKCIGAVGIGHLQSAAPTYAVECCPPSKRGLLVALYSAGSGFGTFIVALVCYFSSNITNDWAWKMPVICQIPIAGIYACGVFMFPESPRWLMTKGNDAEARRSFSRLYSRSADSPEISAQIQEVAAAIELERALGATTTWMEIFHRNFIRRTLIATVIVVGAPICGTFFIFTYAAIFLTTVGISDPFTVVLILNACSFAGSLLGPFVTEYLGRRVAMLTGYAGTAICMLIVALVSSVAGLSVGAVKDAVAGFLCAWAFLFSAFIASTMWVASAEMHALRHRTYAQAFITTLSNILVFASNFWTPYMISPEYGNMGTHVGYFYFGLELVIFVILFLIVPETGRLSLEQIDNCFVSEEKAWRTSLAKNKKLSQVGTVTVAKEA